MPKSKGSEAEKEAIREQNLKGWEALKVAWPRARGVSCKPDDQITKKGSSLTSERTTFSWEI
eukprot:9310495-Prorocentrum_lima.AAC.1